MRKFAVALALLLMSCLSWAQEKESTPSRRLHLLLAVGSEARPEKDVDGHYAIRNLSHYSVGLGTETYLVTLEKATFQESSGNAALNVTRDFEDMMLWGHYRGPKMLQSISPYLGAGAGAYKEKITTRLSGTSDVENETPHKFLSGACFGISFDKSIFWLSVEGRLLFGDELDQQPTVGALARAGLWF